MPPFTVTPLTMHTPSTSSPPLTVEPGGGVPPLGQLFWGAADAGAAIIPSARSAKTAADIRARTFLFANDILPSMLLGTVHCNPRSSRALSYIRVAEYRQPTYGISPPFAKGRDTSR